MFENHQKCFIWIFLFLVFSINFYFDWAVWYHCMTASLYFQKESQQFLAFVLNTFRGHILRSIHHQSLLSVLARIQNTFCKKVYGYILLLWDSFLCILCLLLWWWSSWSSVCNCNVDNTSLYGVSSRLLLAVLVRNLGYVNVPFSYFFMPHFPDRRGR